MTFTIYDDDMAPGSAENNVSGTTLAFSPSSAVPVGKLAILLLASQVDVGLGADTEDTTIGSVSDSKGNTWSRAAECHRNTQRLLAGVYFSVISTQIETSDTITVTFTQAATAKAVTLAAFNITDTPEVVGKDYETATATAYTTTLSGLTSEEHLWIGHNTANSGNSAVIGAKDAAYTSITQGAGTVWSGAAGAGGTGAYLISTGTSETYDNAGPLTNGGRASILVAFHEVAAAVTRRVQTTVSRRRW